MRNAFARVLTELAADNPQLMLFYADIGNRLFNQLKDIAPQRTINAGIAEANMTGMAAGAAKMGMRPFIYTITPFTTARNFEQIKIDIAYQNQPVVIVGTGSGLSYAGLGPTHHSFEDIALMRSLPNMRIVCPADATELALLMPQIISLNAPCYFRIGKKNEPNVHDSLPKLKLGKAHVHTAGERIAILATGTIFPVAQQVQQSLREDGLNAELVSFHMIRPLDQDYLSHAVHQFEHIVTIEEHNQAGGFGSAVLEWFNDRQLSIPVHRFGIPDRFIDQVHTPASARQKSGLNADSIVTRLKSLL
jgi:transketolase